MSENDDIDVESTPGYKPPAKMGIDEMKNKDADDEALNRWKAQLLESQSAGSNPNDSRKVVPIQFKIIVEGRDNIVVDLSAPEKLKDTTIVLKEGSEFRLGIDFKVQNDVVSGLKYVHAVHRKGIRVSKDEHMIGSFGPSSDEKSFKAPLDEVPSGMLARGTYKIKGKLVDDDKVSHFHFECSMKIAKDW